MGVKRAVDRDTVQKAQHAIIRLAVAMEAQQK